MDRKPLIKVKQLSQELGVCRSTIELWRSTHRIPFIRVGRTVLYDADAVRKTLEDNHGVRAKRAKL